MTPITDHLRELQTRIATAAARAGRAADTVRLVGVSKGHGAGAVREAWQAGLADFGENYLQEALAKIPQCGEGPVWHFIGPVQANKTRDLARHFAWVQTVATARVAARLAAQRPFHAPPLQVCIQVRPEGTPGRPGCDAAQVPALAEIVAGLPRLRLRGLMLLPRADLAAAELRRQYQAMAVLLEQLRRQGQNVDTLSMGMSADLELAIEAGSTMVRVGTALFGARPDR